MSKVCPWDGCDYESSERGVNIHHKQKHGKSIAKIEIVCDNCGETDKKFPNQIEKTLHDFCSKSCSSEYRRNRVTIVCSNVGCDNVRDMCNAKHNSSEKHFCSHKCRGEYYSGKRSPTYENGKCKSARGSLSYNEAMKACYERDDYTCQDCGDVGGAKTPHHINRVSTHPDEADDLDNLVLLCPDCHAKRHADAGEWSAVAGITATHGLDD